MDSNKILQNPIIKIIVGLIVCGGIINIGNNIIRYFLDFTNLGNDFKSLISGVIVAILIIFTYSFLFKFYEKRAIYEFSKKGFAISLIKGIFIGSTLQSLTILVIYLYGGYYILSINPILYIVPPLTMAFTSAIIEETLVRGIIFRIIEEKLGSYYALLISALLFGAMHLNNPNSSLIAGIGLSIQAGLLLASAFIYARNLWFPIGIHFAWNFTQSAIFGAKVSGNTISKTLITSKIEGPELYTGGLFGPEGSIQATIICLIATLILLFLSKHQNKFIKPYWSRNIN